MDQSSGFGQPPPRRELQGPRPTPLKVRKDSHRIKKPPVPPAAHHHQQPPSQPPPRPPVIIYAVSPKIIHTNPSDFMTLVQRLTGPGTTSSTATSHPPPSPAARFAAIEKTKIPPEAKIVNLDHTTGYEHLLGTRPGSVLSPGPAGLIRPVPPAFFSDPMSPLISLYHQHDHLNVLQQIHQYGGAAGNYSTFNYNGIFPNTPSAAAAFLSPNPMLSPASVEFLTRLLDQ